VHPGLSEGSLKRMRIDNEKSSCCITEPPSALESPRSYRHIGVAALRAKILSDEAEDEGFGHSKARTTTKYDEIFAATLRAGANFTDFVVARR
jgi:hypothetical protein